MAAWRTIRWCAGAHGAVLFALCGCVDTNQTVTETNDRRALEQRVTMLEQEVVARDDTIRTQSRQIRALQGLSAEERLTRFPHAARIELASMSGGYDADGTAGDEGVVAYVQPYDADGDVIKAAGSLRVQLLDLANPPGSQQIGEYRLDEANLHKAWYGQFMTAHYTVKCPWRSGPPVHPDVTLRVQFIDLVSGRSFERVKLVQVQLPAAAAAQR